MIAHVAAVHEARGRVVLRFCAGSPSQAAISAAFKVAEAFQSEVESLYVEDRELLTLASYPFATEVSFAGRLRRRLSQRTLHGDFFSIFSAARRQIRSIAAACDVPLQERYVRDEPVHALASACAQRGPWNVIALAEAFDANSCTLLCEVFDTVLDTTGVILAGPKGCHPAGPIIVAVEDAGRVPGMLSAAERLAQVQNSPIAVLVVANTAHQCAQLDDKIRQISAEHPNVFKAGNVAAAGEAAVVAEAIRRLNGSFLIARFGGVAIPRQGSLRPLAAVLECPLLLVR
ncbi:MAG: hypothetical protein AAFR90_05340 [Pseudomonadota bacterium]